MPVKRRIEMQRPPTLVCRDCGADLSAQGWRAGTPVYHCEGGMALFARITTPHLPHHCPTPTHPPCWKCGAPMGCARCAGPATELICRRCQVLANKTALLAGGVLRGQTLDDYPPDWHNEYAARRVGSLFGQTFGAQALFASGSAQAAARPPAASKRS